jgi:7-cyano-7-deazaguanine synthase
MGKALVLNSGGVDSTTCVGLAVQKYGKENVITASLYYGQKHDKELQCAKKIAEYYGVGHIEEDISNVMKYAKDVCTLMKGGNEIEHKSYAEQIAENGEGRVATYVPFRNGLLLSIATAYADSLFPGEEVEVYYGAHADDAAGEAYADCSPEFAKAMDEAISIGTYGKIHINRPLINMNKAGVVKTGLEIGVPYELTWSCYEGREKACGTCGTCIDRINAFKLNGVEDPIEYMDNNVKKLN